MQPEALGRWAVGRGSVTGSTQAAGEKEERSEGAGSPCLQAPRCGGFVCMASCCRCAGSRQLPQCAAARPSGCGFSLACSRRAGSSHAPRGALRSRGPHGGSVFGLWPSHLSWDAFGLDAAPSPGAGHFACAVGLSTHLSTCRQVPVAGSQQDPACMPTVPSTPWRVELLGGSGK